MKYLLTIILLNFVMGCGDVKQPTKSVPEPKNTPVPDLSIPVQTCKEIGAFSAIQREKEVDEKIKSVFIEEAKCKKAWAITPKAAQPFLTPCPDAKKTKAMLEGTKIWGEYESKSCIQYFSDRTMRYYMGR